MDDINDCDPGETNDKDPWSEHELGNPREVIPDSSDQHFYGSYDYYRFPAVV